MLIPINELQFYKNFNALAEDILEMAKQFFPDKLIYLTYLSPKNQVILKLSEANTSINIQEGMIIERAETVCNRIEFDQNKPLIFEDMSKETNLDDLRSVLVNANINSYLGVPIMLANGDTFGTLCAAHTDASEFNKTSVSMIQKIANLFSYYLNLERIAYRDSLTGIYNRQFLYKYFEEIAGAEGALFFLDLDGFKKVNDTHGHETGDMVLKEVARRLEQFIQNHHGFVVRLGGDEFIVNLVGVVDKAELGKHAETILALLSSWDTQLEEFHVSVSIGIAPYVTGTGNDLKLLLKNADNALYRSKADGKNMYHFFN